MRIEHMTINIEKMRAEMRAENKRFMWQAIGAIGGAAGGGAALMALILHLMGRI
jgi:hypothetical protein